MTNNVRLIYNELRDASISWVFPLSKIINIVSNEEGGGPMKGKSSGVFSCFNSNFNSHRSKPQQGLNENTSSKMGVFAKQIQLGRENT